jgi:type VI secretion system secreted protein Hcp
MSSGPQHPSFYLKIAEIKGEARAQVRPDEIELMSWSWGETQTVFPSETRKTGGSVAMRDFQFIAKTGAASSQLLLCCAAAKRFKTAVLTCEQDGPKGRHHYLTITLSNVVVASYDIDASGDSGPVDRVTLKFTKIEFTYSPQEKGGNFSATWDLTQNDQTKQ